MGFNKALLNKDVQQYILEHAKIDVLELLLKGRNPFNNISLKEVAQQIEGRQKISKKAPEFLIDNLIFPPKLNLEQSSSTETALYKKSLINNFTKAIDCTGGFGIDSFYLAKGLKEFIYCETNKELFSIVEHNFSILNKNIKCLNTDGVAFVLNNSIHYDVIYIDPSRRNKKGKVISLEESTPNILLHWNNLLNSCSMLLIKLSPMLDLDYIIKELPNIYEIHIVSVKNDVKEIILLAKSGFNNEVKFIAADISNHITTKYSELGKSYEISPNLEFNFIYEPYGVLLKSKLNDSMATKHGLLKVAHNSNFYLSNSLEDIDLFKKFKIIDSFNFNKKQLKKRVGKEPIEVVSRNFPLKPEQILGLLNSKQGGDRVLICTTAPNKQKVCFITKRIL